jgi:acetolactate synthase-1/2/3 large subunit
MESLPDFVKLAEAYGHVGMRIEDPKRLKEQLADAFSDKYKDRFVFIDIITDQQENVYPMIPAGAGLNEMILV